jgi:hypothetical protein
VARHGRWWTSGPPVRSLRAVASSLRRRSSLGPEREAPPEKVPSPRERWSAERVSGALEDVVSRGAHALRRSRWLCALSECSLAWSTGEGQGPARCLVVSRGAVVARQDMPAAAGVPEPPGHATALRERQEALDLAVYDRLSALSRELRALVASGRPVTLRLGPGPALDRKALGEALRCL